MSILEAKSLAFSYGDEQLYQNTDIRFFEGEHAVLVGPNGSGKSTLLKLFKKELKPDNGTIEWLPTKQVGYLDQYAKIDGDRLVRHYLYEVFLPLFEKEKQMENLYEQIATVDENEYDRILERASKLGDELVESDFYAIKSKVGDIIHGLGLSMDLLDDPIKHLSGGMRAKIILAKLLLEEADVLLLDEPTNFLDVKHIEWLTRFLNQYPKAFLVVSHHEEFLRAIATTVFAIENKAVVRYKGDYDFYVKERILREEQHKKSFKSQQAFIARTEDFIQKNITRDKTSKRAQSRRKMLGKLDRIARPTKSRTYKFFFPLSRSTGRDVLVTKDLEIGYDEVLVEPITMTIMREEKVVITGKNGIGKSTLLKTVLDVIEPLGGSYTWIDTAKIAYFEQESNLEKALTPFQIVHNQYPDFTIQQVMSLLGGHGIDYEMARRKIGTLSGGEQTKVRLALLRHQKGNVLIIDEPTNHLDAAAKEALKEALIAYKGTLILVSHEKAFYEAICDYEISLYA